MAIEKRSPTSFYGNLLRVESLKVCPEWYAELAEVLAEGSKVKSLKVVCRKTKFTENRLPTTDHRPPTTDH